MNQNDHQQKINTIKMVIY